MSGNALGKAIKVWLPDSFPLITSFIEVLGSFEVVESFRKVCV
ncbi:MAG: hypothetical protein ABIA11_03510 [Patescibacteria group bacterium]